MTDPYQMDYFKQRTEWRKQRRRRRFRAMIKWACAYICIGLGTASATCPLLGQGANVVEYWIAVLVMALIGGAGGFLASFKLSMGQMLKKDPDPGISHDESARYLGIPCALLCSALWACGMGKTGWKGMVLGLAGGFAGLFVWWCAAKMIEKRNV